MAIIILFVIVCVVLFFVIRAYSNSEAEREEREKKHEEYKQKIAQQQIIDKNAYASTMKKLTERYGVLSSDIRTSTFNEYKLASHILVFAESKVILIREKKLNFSDILGYSVHDNSQTVITNEASSVTTETSTGSALGRAAVGGLLLGGVGAAAGAITAKKETTIHPSESSSTTRHHYIMFINLNDFSEPTLELDLKSDYQLMNQVSSILNIILSNNKA